MSASRSPLIKGTIVVCEIPNGSKRLGVVTRDAGAGTVAVSRWKPREGKVTVGSVSYAREFVRPALREEIPDEMWAARVEGRLR